MGSSKESLIKKMSNSNKEVIVGVGKEKSCELMCGDICSVGKRYSGFREHSCSLGGERCGGRSLSLLHVSFGWPLLLVITAILKRHCTDVEMALLWLAVQHWRRCAVTYTMVTATVQADLWRIHGRAELCHTDHPCFRFRRTCLITLLLGILLLVPVKLRSGSPLWSDKRFNVLQVVMYCFALLIK